jgi:hypothetical protein
MPQPRTAQVAIGLIALLIWAPAAISQESPFGHTMLVPPKDEKREEEKREQEEEPENPWEKHLETDRDAFTPATRIVERGLWILESSYSFIDNRSGAERHSFPELLLRYGLTDRLELRFGWNYEVGGGGNVVTGQGVGGGEEDLAGISREYKFVYGVKAQVSRQCRLVPNSCAIVQGHTTIGSEPTVTNFSAGYVWGWELPNKWTWDSAIRYATSGEAAERFTVWAPSTVLRIPLGDRWQVHAEYFGLFSQDRQEEFSHQFFSPGMHFLVTPNLEIGVRVGWGLNDQSARFFSNAGVGWRF